MSDPFETPTIASKAKYVLLSEQYEPDYFRAQNDEAAEQYVEETYDQDDGPMKLYRLEPVIEWP